jgi:N-acetylglutamate synthase-like GNAT family acetyltransferase
MSDIAPLLELINGYAAKGIMLPAQQDSEWAVLLPIVTSLR